MKIDKPTEADKAYFVELFGEHPALEIKAMFGNLAAFVSTNEQMCAGLFGAQVGLRLGEDDRAELLAESGAGPFGPEGRPMKQYVAIPPGWRDAGDELDGWIDRAVAHTASLPPKKKKASKKKTPKKKPVSKKKPESKKS